MEENIERDYIDMEETTKLDFAKAIYDQRENFYNIITGEIRQRYRNFAIERDRKYSKFIKELSVLDDEKRDKVIKRVGEYTASINEENGKFSEEYYKAGLKDGIKLILQSLD